MRSGAGRNVRTISTTRVACIAVACADGTDTLGIVMWGTCAHLAAPPSLCAALPPRCFGPERACVRFADGVLSLPGDCEAACAPLDSLAATTPPQGEMSN